jgi:putative NADH-flavin reductase
MKLTVFGATGAAGTQVVKRALAAGHEVNAVARDPARMTVPDSPRLRVTAGDVMDPESITPAVAGADAVLSAIGPRGTGPPTVSEDSARSIIAAMRGAGAARLLTVSGAIVTDDGLDFLLKNLVFPLVRIRLRNVCADMRAAEALVRASGLDWTILRPPTLTDKAPRGDYRTALDRNLPRGANLSRADLAEIMIRLIDDPASAHHAISVAY